MIEIKSQTVIWTGGVRGNRLIEEAGFETMRGRVKVDASVFDLLKLRSLL